MGKYATLDIEMKLVEVLIIKRNKTLKILCEEAKKNEK